MNIAVNIAEYEAQLRGEIASDLWALERVLEGIANSDYSNRKFDVKAGFVISEITVPHEDFIKQREINKCFKSITSSLQDHMDKLIAILRLKSEKITLTPTISPEDLKDLLSEKFANHLLDVSSDLKLNTRKKLSLLLDTSQHQIYRKSLKSLFDLRNALEHHKGIAKADRIVSYTRLALVSTSGKEIEGPSIVQDGEGVSLTTIEEEIAYDKGGVMVITQEQLNNIVLSLLIKIIPTLQVATTEKLNN